MNPYNCTRPGNSFVGYEEMRRELLADLTAGKSFAVLGGRRCGKTSLLLQIEKDLKANKPGGHEPLVCFLDMQSLGEITPGVLFQAIYERVVQDLNAPSWAGTAAGGEYSHFLAMLDRAKPALNKRYGANWLCVLLVDELDAAVTKLPNDQFFQNLRNFLMVSRFNGRFRLIASGVKEMARLISSGSSPLNNLCHVYLRVLTPGEGAQLIAAGFPSGILATTQETLSKLTGLHPYLLQGLLEKLFKKTSAPTSEMIKVAATDFMREHKDFRRWLEGFTPAERAVYQLLARTSNGSLSCADLRKKLDPGLVSDSEEALTALSYHGLIDDSEPDKPGITSTMFRDWFLENLEPQAELTRKELLLSLLTEAEDALDTPEADAKFGRSSPGRSERERPAPDVPDHDLVGEEPIGSGSYGTVWLAKTLMGTYRAVKVVYRSTFDEEHPFEREFKGIRKYEPISRTHPGLVQILQVGLNESAGYFYYVMEVADDDLAGQAINHEKYLPRNLRNVLSRGPLPLAESVNLGLGLADALKHLHHHRLIHRDIKPANIIFVNAIPKLADIGLVTEMQSNAANATWIGTEGYIPPEGPGTALADIYSLGKVLYEASTGLDCGRFPELSSRVEWGAQPRGHNALNDLIIKACEDDPKKRYQTVTQLHTDLLAVQRLAQKRARR